MILTLPELRQRYESGEKQQKRVQKKIDQQLARVCENPECKESLAFSRKAAFCSTRCRNRLGTIKRKANREKKKRWEAKHGIVRDKNIRNRNAVPTLGFGVEYAGQTLLYENYKEPLKEIEKGKGFGYYGTVALTEDKSLVQCHICGHLFPSVGNHLRKHKISASKYKELFKLSATTALISEPVRLTRQEKVVSKLTGKGLPPWLREYNKKVQAGEIRHPGTKRKEGGMSLEKRNELGLCPDQVLEKILDLKEKLGHVPGTEEFEAEYGGRYMGSIIFQHGSWTKAVNKLGMQTKEELRRLSEEKLIAELQEFYEVNKRIPMTSDFARGMLRSKGAYISKFGSLNNARIAAGMNAVLPMPFGQVVELTPQQYADYQAGHLDPRSQTKNAQKMRARYAAKRAKKAQEAEPSWYAHLSPVAEMKRR